MNMMGKNKRKTFFTHQQFNKKMERERERKRLEKEQQQQQEEEEEAQQQQLQKLEKAQLQIQRLQYQLEEAQLINDALEAANRENQRENIWLHDQVQRAENNARQRQYRRGRSRKEN
jgi:hypothetical protein